MPQTLSLNELPVPTNDQRLLVVSLPTSENVYVFQIPADATIKEWGHQMGIKEERGLRVLHVLLDHPDHDQLYGNDAALMIIDEGDRSEHGCVGNCYRFPRPSADPVIIALMWKTGRPDPDFTDRELQEANERTREACCGKTSLIYIT